MQGSALQRCPTHITYFRLTSPTARSDALDSFSRRWPMGGAATVITRQTRSVGNSLSALCPQHSVDGRPADLQDLCDLRGAQPAVSQFAHALCTDRRRT